MNYRAFLVENCIAVMNEDGEGILLYNLPHEIHNRIYWDLMMKLETITNEIWTQDRLDNLLSKSVEV